MKAEPGWRKACVARLNLLLRRAVELALVEVASADEREYLARVRVYRDERAFMLHRGDELLGLGLEVFVYRRVYAETAAVNPVRAV